MTIMSVEIHIQSRIVPSSKTKKDIALTPQSTIDAVHAISYVFSRDPGGGDELQTVFEGCLYLPVMAEQKASDETLKKRLNLTFGPRPPNTRIEYEASDRCEATSPTTSEWRKRRANDGSEERTTEAKTKRRGL